MRVVVVNDEGLFRIFIPGVEGDSFLTLRGALRLSQADCAELTVELHSAIDSSCRRWAAGEE